MIRFVLQRLDGTYEGSPYKGPRVAGYTQSEPWVTDLALAFSWDARHWAEAQQGTYREKGIETIIKEVDSTLLTFTRNGLP